MSIKNLFLILFILAACAAPEKVVEKVVVQCWDGSTADSVEACPLQPVPEKVKEAVKEEIISPPVVLPATKMQELLEKVPSTYWFTLEDVGVVVQGSNRSTGFWYSTYANYFYRLMYWNTDTKTIYVHCCEIDENWWKSYTTKTELVRKGLDTVYLPAFFVLNFTGDKEVDKTRIPKEFNKYWYDAKESELIRLFEPFYTKSPVDWMKEYATEEPVEVDETSQMLSWAGGSVESVLSLKFVHKERPDHFIVFRFDKRFNLPLVLDEMDGEGKLLSRTSYDFNTVYVKQGQKNVKLADSNVSIPSNSIIVTTEDYDAWREFAEG